jgi:hypothetical protein
MPFIAGMHKSQTTRSNGRLLLAAWRIRANASSPLSAISAW